MQKNAPNPVLLIHGIRTRGTWQKDFADALSRHSIPHHTFDYGYFGPFRFAFGPTRNGMVERFYHWYLQQKKEYPSGDEPFRPDIVAHSLGSYIVAKTLLKYSNVNFRKLIFCGSIAPTDYDWEAVFARSQVLSARNDHGFEDIWSKLVRLVVRDAGPSGYKGFEIESRLLDDMQFDLHGHSDYFQPGHYEAWIEFLRAPGPFLFTVRSSDLPARLEWTKVVSQLRALDREIYGGLPFQSDAAIPEGLSTKWMESNSDLYTLLVDRSDQVRGYINAMPLSPTPFNRVINGELLDNAITPSDIETYQNDSEVDLYLMSIAVHESCRSIRFGSEQPAVDQLLFNLTERWRTLAKRRRIFVRRVAAIAWTETGRRLCDLLGMEKAGTDKFSHPIYMLDMLNAAKEGRENRITRKLFRTYREML